MSTRTRFEKEAKGNSEMAYYFGIAFIDSEKVDFELTPCMDHLLLPSISSSCLWLLELPMQHCVAS